MGSYSRTVTVHELSRQDARRIAVRAQLLERGRPDGLLDVVRRLTLLQIDPTAAIAPNADLVAWSRLGSSYSRSDLDTALQNRAVLELRAMIRPAEDLALYRADMAVRAAAPRGRAGAGKSGCRPTTRACATSSPGSTPPDRCRPVSFRIRAPSRGNRRGGRTTATSPRCWSSWRCGARSRSPDGRAMTGCGTWRRRVYPDDPAIPVEEAGRRRNERRLRALGIARARGPECPVEPMDVGDVGELAVVDGVKGEWRVEPSLLGQPFKGRAALLSPFDRLIHDRKRLTELFGFDYQLEMYKPAAKRRWGYFALPILYADRLVGKLDATADRKAGVLRVDAVHHDVDFTKTMTADVKREIADLARWLELDLVSAA